MGSKRIIIFSILLSVLMACEKEGPCTQDVLSKVYAGFYSVKDDSTVTVKTLDSLAIYGSTRPDSVIILKNIAEINFNLAMNDDKSTIIMNSDSLSSNLNFYYTNTLVLISTECGFTDEYQLYDIIVNGDLVDSVVIVQPHVNLSDVENIKIFF